jgi:4'-phosphopantetheinyl transferase
MAFELHGPALESIGPGTADLWFASLDVDDEALGSMRRCLSTTEQRRADRFVFDRDRTAFIASHAALRQVLARYLGCAAADVEFGEAPQGKPFLRMAGAEGLEFNLSHSGGFACIGVTRGAAIGVDIEAVRNLDDMPLLARQCFAPAEVDALEQLPPAVRLYGFFNAWTRKEAYIKATGAGLSCPLESFEVTLAPGDEPRIRVIDGSAGKAARWSLRAVVPMPGLLAAMAVDGIVHTMRCGWCVAPQPALV